MCWNSLNNKVYCANYESDGITVIDGASNLALASVHAGAQPYAICYNTQCNKVYCANEIGSSVTVIDGASDSVLKTVGVGAYPEALCYSPQGNKVCCANRVDENVTVLDGQTDSVVVTIAVGARPRDLLWCSVKDRVYVANFGGSSISVLRDSGGGIEETRNGEVRRTSAATVVRSVLFLPQSLSPSLPITLLDVTGRQVMVLRPGPNDVSHLAPGVYFVRELSAVGRAREAAAKPHESAVSVRKVVLTE
jgi:YVTN family beta-propeller protein